MANDAYILDLHRSFFQNSRLPFLLLLLLSLADLAAQGPLAVPIEIRKMDIRQE